MKKTFHSRILGLLACLVACASSSMALAEGRESASIAGDLSTLLKPPTAVATGSGGHLELSPKKLSGRIPHFGRFSVTLEREARFIGISPESGIRSFQGRVTRGSSGEGSSGIATLTVSPSAKGHEVRLMIEPTFSRQRGAYRLLHLFGPISVTGSTELHVSRLATRKDSACGTKAHEAQEAHTEVAQSPVKAKSLRAVSVLVHGDVEYFQAAGPGAVAEMVSMTSTSDAWYQRDLGVRLFAAIEPNPQNYAGRIAYDSNSDFEYFADMRNRVPTFAEDAFHVFTGKRPAQQDLSSLAGIAADIGSLCRAKTNSIAISIRQRGDSVPFVAATFAHELGHLAALRHDDQSTGRTAYLMHSGTVSTSNSLDEFSSQSKSEWAAFLARQDTQGCFPATDGSAPPPPNPQPPADQPPAPGPAPAPEPDPETEPGVELEADIFQERIGKRDAIIIEAYRGDDAAIGEPVFVIEILRGNRERKVASRRTNGDGIAVYYPPRSGTFYAVVGDDEYETDLIKFKRSRR